MKTRETQPRRSLHWLVSWLAENVALKLISPDVHFANQVEKLPSTVEQMLVDKVTKKLKSLKIIS